VSQLFNIDGHQVEAAPDVPVVLEIAFSNGDGSAMKSCPGDADNVALAAMEAEP
jgi:hypothetical protein